MAATPGQRDRPVVVAKPGAPRQASLNDRIAAIAERGAAMLSAERCAIAYQSGPAGANENEVVCARRADSRWDAVVNAALGALANRLEDALVADEMTLGRGATGAADSIEMIALSAEETGAIARSGKMDEGRRLLGSAFSDGVSSVRIAMVVRADRTDGELQASFELMAGAVFGEMAAATARTSLEFWRSQGAESGRQAVDAKQELAREREAATQLDDAVERARRAPPNERFDRFGELVASEGGFDQWMVAVADGGSLKMAASWSKGPAKFELIETASALAESFRRRIVIARWRGQDADGAERDKLYSEDKIFSGPYVCIPFEAGAIALASKDGHTSAARAEAIVERLAPLATSWAMAREISRRDGLERQLALRMFAAIDEERARIARDLHDDQAQLLAAAKIALDGPREAARAIFEQIESELRRKTRELRPATLGNLSLDDAIEGEFARLKQAGVKAKLIHAGAADKISRPVQQLCFQVIRESLSNVIRHAHAKAVQIAIESTDSAARVSVIDNGRGISDDGRRGGVGLAGVRERLELMGGSLKIDSRAGRTSVVAEIPDSV